MMGVNDCGEHLPYRYSTTSEASPFFKYFRTYKLGSLLWLHIVTKLKETGIYRRKEDRGRAISTQTEESYKKAIEFNPKDNRAYIELGQIYRNQGKYSQSEESYKKAIEFNPENDKLYAGLAVTYKETGRYESAQECYKKANELRLEYYNPVTRHNYLRLKEILDKRGIKLVCVQYPVRSAESLRKIFVDNERVFKEASNKKSYKEYFIDIFGGDFGHCTYKGNRLLAENIANVILKECFNRR
jgi:tetratricopeptide (TPR) repeat protein